MAAHYLRELPPNPLGFDQGPGVLRVIVDTRRGPVRTLLNAEELVAACNKQGARWVAADRRRQPADSLIRRIQCRRGGRAVPAVEHACVSWAGARPAAVFAGAVWKVELCPR